MRTRFPVTVHLFFIRAGQILLSRRFQTGYMDGYYSVPAGHLEGDEPVRLAGVREASEETGLEIDPGQMEFAGVFHRREGDERVDFFFRVVDWPGQPVNREPQKCDDLRWFDLQALPQNTVPYVRQAIANLRRGVFFEEYGWQAEEGSAGQA